MCRHFPWRRMPGRLVKADTPSNHLNMSWQAYVDNMLQSQKVDQAALYSRAGDSVWAASSGFDVSSEEIQRIALGFDDPSQLQEHGLYVHGQKYFLLKVDVDASRGDTILGKQGDSGIVAFRTKQALLLGHYSPPVLTGEATNVVEAMGAYLLKAGY